MNLVTHTGWIRKGLHCIRLFLWTLSPKCKVVAYPVIPFQYNNSQKTREEKKLETFRETSAHTIRCTTR